jgi:hypothetical protein
MAVPENYKVHGVGADGMSLIEYTETHSVQCVIGHILAISLNHIITDIRILEDLSPVEHAAFPDRQQWFLSGPGHAERRCMIGAMDGWIAENLGPDFLSNTFPLNKGRRYEPFNASRSNHDIILTGEHIVRGKTYTVEVDVLNVLDHKNGCLVWAS